MKASEIIGKKIVGVDQERGLNSAGLPVYHVSRIKLEGGLSIVFDVDENYHDGCGYIVDGQVFKLNDKGRRVLA